MDLNQVTLPATDVERAVEFYRRLGFRQIVSDLPQYARFECIDGSATFSLHKVDSFEPSDTIVYFECKNLDAVCEQLQAQGIAFDQAPVEQPWLWREAYLRDPAGNQLCLYHAGSNRRFPPWRIADPKEVAGRQDQQSELDIVRKAYSKQILAIAGVRDPRIEAAFAGVRREQFLGQGPWQIYRWWLSGYTATPDADPVYVYTNDVIGIDPARQINNGEPAFHANLLAEAMPKPGEHVVHIGTGGGYYTAILAHLVGPTGHVTGIEFEPDLADRARSHLADVTNVDIRQGDGTKVAFDQADVIYVNAGATEPSTHWLDRLADRGRLIIPLTSENGFAAGRSTDQVSRSGAVFRIERRGPDYSAKWISAVAIYPCAGGRHPSREALLANALAQGRWKEVTRLYRDQDVPDERCWLRGAGWCLAYN